MPHVLICGTSTRAVAESAARAGFRVTAIDAFADLDQHPAVRALSTARDLAVPPAAPAMARAARTVDSDAVVYLSPFENHPHAVTTIATGRALWGNSSETLRRVRDPFAVARVLRKYGFTVPRLLNDPNDANDANDPNDSNDPNDPNDRWLVKPFRSGGGHRIRPWRGGPVLRTSYLQERIDGTPGSLVFVAAAGGCVPLGFSRQLIGDARFGAGAYRFCGSILASADDRQFDNGRALLNAAMQVARLVASEFGVVGINGIDFIARDGVPVLLEVNPRWSSSVEVAERAFSTTFFAAHADACSGRLLSPFDCAAALGRSAAVGKAIVYSRQDMVIGDTASWLDDADVRDVPRSGERVRAGQPVCSVFATAADSAACYRALVERANRLYAELERGRRVRATAAAG